VDVFDFYTVRGIWDLTCDFWAENGKRKITVFWAGRAYVTPPIAKYAMNGAPDVGAGSLENRQEQKQKRNAGVLRSAQNDKQKRGNSEGQEP
jgi:hypothetical protein